jgi:hypothetical protein
MSQEALDRRAEGTRTTDVSVSGTLSTDIVGLVQDFIAKLSQNSYFDQIYNGKVNFLLSGWDMLDLYSMDQEEGNIGVLRAELEAQLDLLKLGLQAGVWAGMGSTFASIAEKWMGTGQLLTAYKTLALNTALIPRQQRRYNRYWRPTYPSFRTAFELWIRGHISESELKDALAYEGWPDKYLQGLIDIYDRDPSYTTAFYMWRKGSISKDEVFNRMKEQGYLSQWHEALLENEWYVPTLYDLCRLADYVEVPETWAVNVLRRRGLKDEDIAVIYPMLKVRYLREEQRALTNKWLWRYRYGLASDSELENALISLGVKAKERELLIAKAKMDYEDELNEEKRNVCTAQYRAGVISYDEYIACLEATGMAHEKANVMADYEEASGYGGYY